VRRLLGVTDAVAELADAVATVLDRGLSEEESIAAMRPAMDRLLALADELPADASQPDGGGGAIGHLLHADPGERFHILSVVFPPGTSSGTHEHGCWGIIGYVAGLDEETRYRRVDGGSGDDGCVLEEVDRVVHDPGTVSRLLPPDEMHHRVRNPGTVNGVSVHVLCRLPESHPHKFYDREHHRLLPYPFRVLPDALVRAEVELPG
jgi:predicted metal-dependent enzyme (double-stranded beta helix superfamily)